MSLFFRSHDTRPPGRAGSPHRTFARAFLLALVWCVVAVGVVQAAPLHVDQVFDFSTDLEDVPAGIDWVYYWPGGQANLTGTYHHTGEYYFVDPVWDASGKACNPNPGTISVLRISLDNAYITNVALTWTAGDLGLINIQATDDTGALIGARHTAASYGGTAVPAPGTYQHANVDFLYIALSTAGVTTNSQAVTCIDDITVSGTAVDVFVDRSDVAGVGDPARIYADDYDFTTVISDSYLTWGLSNPTAPCWVNDAFFDLPLSQAVAAPGYGNPAPGVSSTGITTSRILAIIDYPEPVRVWWSFDANQSSDYYFKYEYVLNDSTCYLSGIRSNGWGQNHISSPGEITDIEKIELMIGVPDWADANALLDNLNVRGEAKGDSWDQAMGFPDPPQPDFYQPITAAALVTYSHYESGGEILSASNIATLPRAEIHNTVADSTVTDVYQATDTYGLVVEIQTPYYYKQTFSNLQIVYVKPGDLLKDDCIIGLAGPPFTQIQDPPPQGYSQFLFSVQDDESNYLDWTQFDEPTSTAICGSEYRTKNCINNNPRLEDYGEGWAESKGIKGYNDNVIWFDDYVTIKPNGYIYQDIVLDTASTYYVSMVATTTSGQASDTITVTLGDNVSADVDLSPASPGYLTTVESDPVVPLETLTRLQIKNDNPASAGFNVHFVCIHEGDAVIAPGQCYFNDPQLARLGLPDWTLLGGATSEGTAISNAVDLYTTGDGLSTPIQLTGFTDAAADYTLVVKADIDGVNLIDDLIEATSSYATLDAYIDTGGTPYTLGSIDVHSLIPKKYEIPFTVPTATSWIGDFTLDLDSLTGSPDYARIHSICLTVDGGIWPGFEDDPDYSDPDSYAWDLQCAAAPSPPNSGLRVWQWIAYVGASMYYVVSCSFIPWLLAISNPIRAVIDGIGLLGLYLGSLALFWAGWLADLIGGLGALLYDIVRYGIASLINDLLSLDLIARLWDRLGLLPIFGAFVRDLFVDLIALIVSAVNLLASMGRAVLRMFTAWRTAINDPSMQDLGLPNCATIDDAAALAPLCWGMDAVDYVISSTLALQVAGVIVAFVIAYETIQWSIAQFSDMAGDM